MTKYKIGDKFECKYTLNVYTIKKIELDKDFCYFIKYDDNNTTSYYNDKIIENDNKYIKPHVKPLTMMERIYEYFYNKQLSYKICRIFRR